MEEKTVKAKVHGVGIPPQKSADEDSVTRYGPEYVYFCRKIRELTGINLENYKGQQMHRRLEGYRVRHGFPDFVTFAKVVQKDPAKLSALVDFLTINVSEFFRNPEQWKILREKVIPGLLQESGKRWLRAWSAGSSGGQEAYSLAITLRELSVQGSILATDIDEPSLAKGTRGKYSRDELRNVPASLVGKYFHPEGDLLAVNDDVKDMVTFRTHNLLSEDYPQGMDLVLCRNVLIYFTEEGKRHVIGKLARSLRPGGVLFVGATEAIFAPKNYGLSQMLPFFYSRG